MPIDARPASTGRRLAAVAVTALLLVACGDDGEASEQPDVSEPGATQPDEPEPDEGADPAETNGVCSVLLDDAVAAAVGVEVEDAESSFGGGGSTDGFSYSSRSCSYELASADGDEVRVSRLFDESGDVPFGADELETMRARSVDDPFGSDFEHEDVTGVGAGAFFSADSFGNVLVVDVGGQVLEITGELDGEPMERALLLAVAEAAVAAFG